MTSMRDRFLLDRAITFLNHGSFGATPKDVFDVYQKWQLTLENQPVEFLGRRYRDLMAHSRAVLGNYLGTSGDNLVYTTNVTEALNIVAHSLSLGSGDEVLATNHEYGAIDRMWRFLSKECGFKYINQNIQKLVNEEEFLENFWRGVTSHTKVISISHITSPTALLIPIHALVQKARNHGILTIIDGAHAPGQIPLNLDALGADFYGGNLHKWLCAPKGAGFLFANPCAQGQLKPNIVSWGYEAEIPGPNLFVDQHEWTGTRDISSFLSVPAAIDFQEENNWEYIRSICRELVSQVQKRIASLLGEPLKGKNNGNLQMIAIPLPIQVNSRQLQSDLYSLYKIEVPVYLWNNINIIRVSIQGYNTQEDVDKLLNSLKVLLFGGKSNR